MENTGINKYDFLCEIGTGGMSNVYQVQNKQTGALLCCKVVSKEFDETTIKAEVAILQKIRHPNIVRVYELCEDSDYYYIIEELCFGSSLLDFINSRLNDYARINDHEIKYIMHQILSILSFLHSCNISHRDIKPENLMIDEHLTLKLIDFGLASEEASFRNTLCGSIYYMAPELIKGGTYNGTAVDIWAAGVIFYILLAGNLPFDCSNIKNVANQILNCKYNFPDFRNKDAQLLLEKMLVVNPSDRISALNALKDPYFTGPVQHKTSVNSASSKSLPALGLNMKFDNLILETTVKKPDLNPKAANLKSKKLTREYNSFKRLPMLQVKNMIRHPPLRRNARLIFQ